MNLCFCAYKTDGDVFFSATFRSAGKLKGKMKLSAGRTKGHLQGEILFLSLFFSQN